jgi:hypothetical protein
VAEFTIEIIGENRDQLALELSVPLSSSQGNVQASTKYSEEDQDPLSTVTTVSVVTSTMQSGRQAAETIWHWWQSSRQRENKVTIRTAGGSVIDLSLIDQKQLEIALTQETAMAGTAGTMAGGWCWCNSRCCHWWCSGLGSWHDWWWAHRASSGGVLRPSYCKI